jgi:hypothetical protein
MPMSHHMKNLVEFAQQNFAHVSVGVTMGLKPPSQGIGIEFTVQPKSERWGFRFRKETDTERHLFFVIEQRPGLFHYGMRGPFGDKGGYKSIWYPHPLTLTEISKRWPVQYWPEGFTLLSRLSKVAKL